MSSEFFGTMSMETLCFVVVILLFNLYFHLRFTPENSLKAPAFLTTLGILGTFVGIALGLMHFDPDNVQKSVPALIGGIKTAVWASALGIFCALTIKFREIWSLRNVKDRASRGATADDIADLLSAIDESIGRLQQGFDRHAERNVELLVAALSNVVQDFNGKISAQFGENFKELHQACGKINELLAKQEQFTTSSERFSKTASDLSSMMTTLERQRSQIETSLTSLATLLNTASDGLPKLEHNLTAMTGQLAEANRQFNQHMGEMVAKTKEQVLVLDAALSEELTKSLNGFGRQLAALSQKFAEDYTPITERLQKLLAIGK